jgi:hypothetical protein
MEKSPSLRQKRLENEGRGGRGRVQLDSKFQIRSVALLAKDAYKKSYALINMRSESNITFGQMLNRLYDVPTNML